MTYLCTKLSSEMSLMILHIKHKWLFAKHGSMTQKV